MSSLRCAAVVAGCAVATLASLETIRWARPIAVYVAREAAPYIRMDDAGVARLEIRETVEHADGGQVYVFHAFDKSGRPLSSGPLDVPKGTKPAPTARDAVSRWSNPWVRSTRNYERCEPALDGPAVVLRTLAMGANWNRVALPDAMKPGSGGLNFLNAPATWTYEAGRFICRDPQTNDVLAGFGPDGTKLGELALQGEKFATGVESPLGVWGWYSPGSGRLGALLDAQGRRIHFLELTNEYVRRTGDAAPDVKPGPPVIDVVTVEVSGPAGEAPAQATDWRYAWLWNPAASSQHAFVVPLRAGRELVLVSAAGILCRVPLEEDERDVIAFGDARCVTTVLPPIGGPVARLRVRRMMDGGKVLTDDVETLPVTAGGHIAAASVGVLTWLRPPVLNVASFAGPRVENYADYFGRFFTDGVIAGGDGAGWLAGSLAVGAICAALVRRQAQRRAPKRAALWTVVGAALGPLAFVWMAIAMPKSYVTACACGRRRAVHVAACPACSSNWPAPAPTGIEVFA